MRGSSPTEEEAKLLSEEAKEGRSSLAKSLESWDLFSDPRDQNGMVICDIGEIKIRKQLLMSVFNYCPSLMIDGIGVSLSSAEWAHFFTFFL
jgi:hypothetical protein